MRKKKQASVPPLIAKEPPKDPWRILASDYSYSFGEWDREPVIEFKDPFGHLAFMVRIPLGAFEEYINRAKDHLEWMHANFPDENPVDEVLDTMQEVTDDTDPTKEIK